MDECRDECKIDVVPSVCRSVSFGTMTGAVTLAGGMAFAGLMPAAEPQDQRAHSGVLQGIVRWSESAVPEPTVVVNTTDPEVCGTLHTLEDLSVSPRTQGLANVIVAVIDVPADEIQTVEPQHLVLDNRQCRFAPHAAVLTVGSTIETTNSDDTLHTVHFYGEREANIALPLNGMRVPYRLDGEGLIAVRCDVHGWMQAFIRVDTHGYHAVTDARGTFRIDRLPTGSYTLEIWHERLGFQQHAIMVEAGQITSVTIDVPDTAN